MYNLIRNILIVAVGTTIGGSVLILIKNKHEQINKEK